MVADSSSEQTFKDLSADQFSDLEDWIRPIQQSLTLEAEHGFTNILGRNESFHDFVSRELSSTISLILPINIQDKLKKNSSGFVNYPNEPITKRRRLVIDTRQLLYSLHKDFKPKKNTNNLKLKFESSPSNNLSVSQQKNIKLSLESEIINIYGVGSKLSEKLASLGLITVNDLLNYFPRDYVDYSNLRRIAALEAGETVTIIATIKRCSSFTSPKNPNLSILELHLFDCTGRIKATRYLIGRRLSNRSFLKSQENLFPRGKIVAVSGLVKVGPYGKSFNDPIIEVLESNYSEIKSETIGRYLPIYSLREGITSQKFRNIIREILFLSNGVKDPLPSSVLKALSLPSKSKAIQNIHSPKNSEEAKLARRRIVFDEFLFLHLSLLQRRAEFKSRPSPLLNKRIIDGRVDQFKSMLPFTLTKAQVNVVAEIESDLACTSPMARLVQGDVGSGKTVVAIIALLNAVDAGWQGAFMAPTEVLAQQHYRNLCKYLPNLHVSVDLLTGSTPRSSRRHILDNISNGSTHIIVGTHALLEDPVQFQRLGLVVVDEQHRFGVNQRNILLNKGLQPHLLTMTATPIPRTLALSMHGDLDVSQIDELPPGRTPIETALLPHTDIEIAYERIRNEIKNGHQAYVVLPLVEESEKLELNSAKNMFEKLSTEVFADCSVGLLHGRMNSSEKQQVIEQFSSNNCDILVSTTVVEVGVDVPNATVMLIDNANRFGLAQLHQLRGRIGRGIYKSYCILINDNPQKSSRQRLTALVNSTNGFEISEMDLQLRGPGQVLGTKQSGLPDFVLASLLDDADILEEARSQALHILSIDPNLERLPYLKELLKDQFRHLVRKTQLN